MNPTQNDPDKTPNIPTATPPPVVPPFDPATFVPLESTPEADSAALHAIATLEAEQNTAQTVSQVLEPVSPSPEVIPQAMPEQPIQTPVPQQPAPYTAAPPYIASAPVTPDFTQPSAPTALVAPAAPTVEQPVAIGTLGTLNAAPAQTNANPFAKKKSSKKLIIILIVAIVVIVGAVAGYLVWQSGQSSVLDTTQQTGGDQPGGTVIPDPADAN